MAYDAGTRTHGAEEALTCRFHSRRASIWIPPSLTDDDDTDGDKVASGKTRSPEVPTNNLPISCSQARYGAALDFNQTATNTFRLFHDVDEKVRVLFHICYVLQERAGHPLKLEIKREQR